MIKKSSIFILLLFFIPVLSSGAAKIVRIGFFEPGPYSITRDMMREIHEQAARLQGDSLEFQFVPEGFKSAEWRETLCRAMAGDLARSKQIDMVIAIGPWVTEALLEVGFDRPIISVMQFDPVASGLIDRKYRPVAKNLTVNFDPGRTARDLHVIDHFFPNSRIGFIYFPSGDEFETVAERIRNIGKQLGHEVYVGEHYNIDSLYGFFGARKQIADSVDVFYTGPLWGIATDKVSQFFSEAHFGYKAMYAYDGFLLLEDGAYFSGSDYPQRRMARFTVDKMIRIAGGAVPQDLPVVFEDFTTICLNLHEASKMGRAFGEYDLLGAKVIPPMDETRDAEYDINLAINQARMENPGLRAIAQTYEKALHEADRARSNYYPKLSARAGAATSDNETEASVYNRVFNREYFADVIADQKIISYNTVKMIHAAKKNLALKETDLEMAKRDLELAVVSAYLEVLRYEDRVDLIRDRMETLRDMREEALTDYRLGYGDTLSAALLEIRQNELQESLIEAKGSLKKAGALFNVLINRPADMTFTLDRDHFTPEIMAGMVIRLESFVRDYRDRQKFEKYLIGRGAEKSLTLKRSEFAIQRQRDLIKANRALMYPELSLRAKYSYSGEFDPEFDKKKHDWTIGGILTFPIFNGFKRSNNNKVLKAELDLLAYDKDAERMEMVKEIAVLTDELTTAMLTLPQLYDIRNKGQANFVSLKGEYDLGKIKLPSLLEEFDRQTAREKRLIDNRYRFFTTYAGWLSSIGEPFILYGTEADRNFYARLQIDMTK